MKAVNFTKLIQPTIMMSMMLCLVVPFYASAADKVNADDNQGKVIKKVVRLDNTSNAKDAIAAFRSAMRITFSKDMDSVAEGILSQYNTPEVATAIANTFLDGSDSTYVMKYVHKALAIDKKYAPAYLTAGELMEFCYKDTQAAAKWYEAGVSANPEHPDCYVAYAKLMSAKDVVKSEAMFNKLRTALPDYPAYLAMSKAYERLADRNINTGVNLANAVEFLEKEKPENLTQFDWEGFAIMAVFKGKEYSLEICKKGLSYFPRYYGLNHSAANYAYELKKWDESQKYFENLMHNCDTLVLKPNNVLRYGICLMKQKNYTKAIECFNNYMSIDSISEYERKGALLFLGECYREKRDYELAEKAFEENISYCRANGEETNYGLTQLYLLYMVQSIESDEKLTYYEKMDSVSVIWAQETPDYAELIYWYRWSLNLESRLDNPKICVQCLEQIVAIDKVKGEENKVKSNMPTVYGYLSRAYFIAEGVDKDLEKADEYCNKCLELDPTNENGLKLRKFIDEAKNPVSEEDAEQGEGEEQDSKEKQEE